MMKQRVKIHLNTYDVTPYISVEHTSMTYQVYKRVALIYIVILTESTDNDNVGVNIRRYTHLGHSI